jgi:hypothetical protein
MFLSCFSRDMRNSIVAQILGYVGAADYASDFFSLG